MQKVTNTKTTLYIPTANFKYFDGCKRYGKDTDGILRVSKTKWSDTISLNNATMDYNKAEALLNAIKKYDFEKGIKYGIATITVTKRVKIDFEEV
ncbi:MAG: hypothetical protein VZS44_09850 [Bacilli bacterium]|nr:hypothetical protein [Bacilli bacterium]